MNMSRKFNSLILLFLITLGFFSANRTTAQRDIRPDTIDDIRNRQYIRNSRTLGTPPSIGIGQSDLGIQRPVEAKTPVLGIILVLIQSSITLTTRHQLIEEP